MQNLGFSLSIFDAHEKRHSKQISSDIFGYQKAKYQRNQIIGFVLTASLFDKVLIDCAFSRLF